MSPPSPSRSGPVVLEPQLMPMGLEEHVNRAAGERYRGARVGCAAAAEDRDVQIVLVDIDRGSAEALRDVPCVLVNAMMVAPFAGADVGVAGIRRAVPQGVVND